MLNFKVLDNGDLRLTCEKGYKRELRKDNKEHGEVETFMQATERYWANGWGVFTADTLSQLSEAPVIVQESTSEDDGGWTLNGNAWYYRDYMIHNFIDKILKDGFVDFTFWQNFTNMKFPSLY